MKKISRYNFREKPKRPSKLLMGIAKAFLIRPVLKKRNFTCEYVNMEGIKPPYFLLATHASMMDFRILYGAIKPHNMNFVVAIDTMNDWPIWLMRSLGGICKRKFIKDVLMIKHMKYAAEKYKNPVCIYPEARYTFDGTPSFVTPAIGKMAKYLDIPVVVLVSYGNFICNQQWNKDKDRPTPLKAKLICVATAEEVRSLSVEEINKRILDNFGYDDFKYQFDNKIKIDYPERARGLHGILYQCCECGTEGEMYSGGASLECRHCGKKWEMTEYGQMKAEDGETRFTHIPDWFKWERENVRREVESGGYCFEDEVEVHTLPKNKYFPQGVGKFRQDSTGTHFYCNAYGKPFEKHLAPQELESVHIEFGYIDHRKKKTFGDCLDISTRDDSFWLHPVNKRDSIMKISFATEELYRIAQEKILKDRKNLTDNK